MHYGARPGLLHERDVFLYGVIGLHLEAPPVGPKGAADPLLRQYVGDLVGLRGVMKSGDLVIELPSDIEHDEHLIGPIAVVVNEDFPPKHAGEGFHLQVPFGEVLARFRRRIELRLVGPSLNPAFPIARHIPHARRGRGAAPTVNPLRVFPARHLQAVGRAGKLHVHNAPRGNILKGDAPAPHQIRRAR